MKTLKRKAKNVLVQIGIYDPADEGSDPNLLSTVYKITNRKKIKRAVRLANWQLDVMGLPYVVGIFEAKKIYA